MTATRIFLAAAISLLLVAPAPAQEDGSGYCDTIGPDDALKTLLCSDGPLEPKPENIRPQRTFQFPSVEELQKILDRAPPTICATYKGDDARILQACSTEELKIADTPPAEHP